MRKPVSLGHSSPSHSTVLISSLTTLFYFYSIHHSRNHHPSFHPMYDLFVRPGRKALQVDTPGPHYRHVLVCNHIQRIRLQHKILLLHRSPTIPFSQLHHHLWTPIRSYRYDRHERLVGRRTFGKFRTKFIRWSSNVGHSSCIQLYRCYTIYSANRWVIALPCLMYLACIGQFIGSFESVPLR